MNYMLDDTKIEPVTEPEEATTAPAEAEAPTEVEATPTNEVVGSVAERTEPAKREPKGGGRFGFSKRGRAGGRGNARGRGPRRDADIPVESDYDEKNVEVTRVTRVTKGGKRMRFRALTVLGNRKGRVGFGLAKGIDVAAATGKAATLARKSLMTVPLANETIPHAVEAKFAAARILLKPAPKGSGVKAGGAVRIVLELAGVPNVVSKILGSGNKINNVKATFVALRKLRARPAKPTATKS